MKQPVVWKLISESLQAGVPCMLLYVLESSGSSPGRQGFAMAITVDGKMEGSIGGGIMEHKFVELAKDLLKENADVLCVRKQIHDKTAAKDQSGMICSGQQSILLYRVKPEDKAAVDEILSSLLENKNGLLRFSPAGMFFSPVSPERDYFFLITDEYNWLYEEKIGHKNTLFIIGGGHCSIALSRIMSLMGFYIYLYDERNNLNTFLQNDFVNKKTIVRNYSDLRSLISSGDHNYVVSMTFGYRTDDAVIRALLDKKFKYFGVLGSSAKIRTMFKEYLSEGIAKEKLKKLHSPAGLPIKSQTPEEIAISIAAEIIKVKNEDL
jgi:xanthine dehydrogenase accessory factor